MNYVQFRRQLRVKLAEKLLKRSSKSVNEVTASIGYKASAYFCREFRKKNGCTTTQFRKSAQAHSGSRRARFL
jgi:two-component system, response regulator YesN